MIERITTPGLAINTYLVIDPVTERAAVVDAVRDIEPILKKIQETGVQVVAILETHVHADFVSGSKELKHRLDSTPLIYCSGLGGKEWIPRYADIVVEEPLEIPLGSLSLEAWHTPGHTPEHLIWVIYDENQNKNAPVQALTGDFLFVGSLGRPDLLGKATQQDMLDQLYDSVFRILPRLPNSLEIFPAHGAGSLCGKSINPAPSSTLSFEWQKNPLLQKKPKELWVGAVLENMPPAPPYFSRMKQLNVKGPALLEELPPTQELSLEGLSQSNLKEFFIVDLRSKEEFAVRHIQGAVNIPFGSMFVNWAPVVIPPEKKLLLISDGRKNLDAAVNMLRIVGLDQELSFAVISKETFPSLKASQESFPLISPQELLSKLKKEPEIVQVVDVRTVPEWQSGHIEGAVHIMLNEISEKIPDLSKDKTLVFICGSGYRSSIAASLMQREGYKDICNVQGGMQEWNKAQLPVVRL